MDMGLRGKVAAVGGASKGIGRAVALGLAREGCRVSICARGEEALARTAEELSALGADALAVPCDMSKGEEVAHFIQATVDHFGRLDIIVPNAGGPPWGPFEAHDEARWGAAIEQNFLSVARMVREALPHLRRQGGGRVINITSTAAKQPIDGLILSNATRLAVAGLAKTLSRELGPDNITVNTVAPGSTLTDRILEPARARAEQEGRALKDVVAEMAADVPLRRLGQPEDVAALVVFLASEAARHITGTTIQVDGGETLAVF